MRRFGSSGAVDIESLPKSDLVPDSCNLGVQLEADMTRSLSSQRKLQAKRRSSKPI
jgi:hypothetical protein